MQLPLSLSRKESTMGVPAFDTDEGRRLVQQRIIHALEIYPKISLTMLQIGIGTNVPPKVWKPELELLKAAGIVEINQIVAESPMGRLQCHNIVSLTDKGRPLPAQH